MQPKAAREAPQYELEDQVESEQPMRYGWSRFQVGQTCDLALAVGRTLVEASQSLSNCTESVPSANVPMASRSKDFVLPKDKKITISVIGGPAKGLAHQLSKPRISIGRAGGATDIEIDDPRVSVLHCAVAVSQNRIKLYDLDSTSGTYVNDERIETAELEHLSEFRVGSSLLLVMILPKREPGIL
jgi:pSer/pThr/pTyr-binding forkhead associated (FHA) protein